MKIFKRPLWLILILVGAAEAHARWLTKTESGSVVEKLGITIDVKSNGAYAQETEYAVRVQAEDAKTSASVFTIEYNSQTDAVEVFEAYTQNGPAQLKVEPGAIEDRDKGEAKDYDAIKVRTVVFPQVQIGSRLYIRYRVTTAKPIMPDRWSDEISLRPGMIVEKFDLQVNSARPLFYKLVDPGQLLKVSRKDAQHLRARNARDFPGWVVAEKEPYFHPAGATELYLSTHSEWEPFMADLNRDFQKIGDAPIPVKFKGWIKRAAALEEDNAKILWLMEQLSREFRYFGDWRRHDGGLIPRTLVEIEKSRYGDCKDLASVLARLLREVGIIAHVALVRRGENPWGSEPDYDLPVTNRFNHAIVRAVTNGKTSWLDATNPVSSLEPYDDIAGRPAYVLDPKGAKFDRLPRSLPKMFAHRREYEYRFKGEDQTQVSVKAGFGGLAAFHLAQELMMAPRSEVLSGTLDYLSEGQDISSYKYVREPKTGRALGDIAIELNYNAGRITYNAGAASFFVIPDGFLGGPFFETAERESDLKLSDEIFLFNGARRLKDVRLAQSLPPKCRVDSEWFDLERRFGLDGADVVIEQTIELRRPFIRRAEFRSAAFKRLQAEVKACAYRSGILVQTMRELKRAAR